MTISNNGNGATDGSPTAPRVCPGCGRVTGHDAVFCTNPACHKALGEFRYVLEELRAQARWHERLAERVTGFIGKPHFLGVHLFWFGLWVLLNSSMVALFQFDHYPFALLGIILAMETIFITGFVLISQNRQAAHADKRAEMDYEVNVRTYRKINQIESQLSAILERLERLEAARGAQEPEARG